MAVATSDGQQVELRQWLADQMGSEVGVASPEIQHDVPFTTYGVDSIVAMSLIAKVQDVFSIELETVALWDYPTIDRLADHLLDRLAIA